MNSGPLLSRLLRRIRRGRDRLAPATWTFCLAATSLSFLTGCGTLGGGAPSSGQFPASFETSVKRELSARYLVHIPSGTPGGGQDKWPLILFLHGAGERGTDLSLVATHGPPKRAAADPAFPFVVVSPQCPADEIWDAETVIALLDHVLESYPVDPGRVYLTGLSMGGFGTWSAGLRHPSRFAAIAPIAGGGNFIELRLNESRREAIRELPIWAFHGAKDAVVSVDESKRMIELAKQLGVKEANLFVFPDAGHDSWTETYASQELYDWFLQHRNEKALNRGKRGGRWGIF